LKSDCEERARRSEDECEGRRDLSKDVGRIGLLGRENATLLNAAIIGSPAEPLGVRGVTEESGIEAPLYLTQNDGTVLRAEIAEKFPVFGFASGPTNSMRGSGVLRSRRRAGRRRRGTTSDVGCLKAGFARGQ
jgi:N-methylhydantoinase A/oxoprolinase/acetone carboxylase beta subunit